MNTENHIKIEFRLVASIGTAEKLRDGFVIATWSNLTHPGAVPFAGSDSRAWHLPELSDSEKEAILERYYDVIASIGLENGPGSLWWYTWTSSRDRFHSRILADMELLGRFRKACEKGLPSRLALVCLDPHLASALKNLAGRYGVTGTLAIGDRMRWTLQWLKIKAAPLVSGYRVCRLAFIQKRRIGKKNIQIEIEDRIRERTLIVTWLKTKNLLDGGPTTDTFFGHLPKFIQADDRSVVLFGDLLDMPDKSTRRGQVDSSLPVLTVGDFYGGWAILQAFIRGLSASIRIPKDLADDEPALRSLIRRDIHINRSAVVYGLLFEGALMRLSRIFRPTQIIHCCENNPWERACVRVARTTRNQPQVTGFMHCAVLLSHPKIVITEKEMAVRPRPQTLVCTGPIAREIMIRHGGHSPDELVAGCALRHEYLWQIKPWERPNRSIKNILVVLDGLPTMPGFVGFIHEALDGAKTYRTVIRPYPLDSPETVMANASIPISGFRTLEFSKNDSLAADFDKADLIIYKSSTVAIEAGYLGIPLINVDFRSILNNDPLFEVTSLKMVVRTPQELLDAIQRFSDMDQDEYARQRAALAEYIKGYFVKPTAEYSDVFLGLEKIVA